MRADFILVSGDTVANMDLRRALDVHRTRRATEKLAVMTMCHPPAHQPASLPVLTISKP